MTKVLRLQARVNDVNDLRQDLFSKRAKLMGNIPPTQVSSIKAIMAIMKITDIQHTNRALYQASILRLNRTSQNQRDLVGHYLNRPGNQCGHTLLPEVARACQELLKCGCKSLPFCSKK